jgi:hypothetical protein
VSPARFPSGPPGPAPGTGPDLDIERLALRVTGLGEDTARTLARLVAEGLAPGIFRSAGNVGLDHLRLEVTVSAAEQERPDLLARRIAGELGRALARGLAPGEEAVP